MGDQYDDVSILDVLLILAIFSLLKKTMEYIQIT
uniref:Uncharacterized protein n=1 Tax=marine metagenome TaxID=408172 RepID=A0A381V0A7_9ZZZZ